MNTVNLVGKVSDAGVRLTWRDNGTQECKWTLVVEEPWKDGAVFRLFCPCVAYGERGETFASTLDAGDLVSIVGKLGWTKATPTANTPAPKSSLIVVAWSVNRLQDSPAIERSEGGEDGDSPEEVATLTEAMPAPRKSKRPNVGKWGNGPGPA